MIKIKISNTEIRTAIKQNKIRFWQVAKEYGISEGTLCRRLRNELSQEEKIQIMKVIKKLKNENNK